MKGLHGGLHVSTFKHVGSQDFIICGKRDEGAEVVS